EPLVDAILNFAAVPVGDISKRLCSAANGDCKGCTSRRGERHDGGRGDRGGRGAGRGLRSREGQPFQLRGQHQPDGQDGFPVQNTRGARSDSGDEGSGGEGGFAVRGRAGLSAAGRGHRGDGDGGEGGGL
ncbi:unnamed protein product, partial [Ectocarpus fasciculatus]